MAADTPFADGEETADEWLRLAWEDTPDGIEADRRPWRQNPRAAGDPLAGVTCLYCSPSWSMPAMRGGRSL